NDAVTDVLDRRATIFHRLWQPLAVAALNTEVEHGAAALLGRVLAEAFRRGGSPCRPLVPEVGLSESLVDPALAWLRAAGVELRLGSRPRGIGLCGGRGAGPGLHPGR